MIFIDTMIPNIYQFNDGLLIGTNDISSELFQQCNISYITIGETM